MVWSDPEIRKLSREFVTVADEVYMLYPEDPGNLERVKNNPEHVFFKRFGAQVPKPQWNHPGTKQGIYMMGPDAEYLEARFASSDARDILGRMRRALERWETLRKAKGYANQPVPVVKSSAPPEVAGNALILRVNLRDLPRSASDRSGARYESVDRSREMWFDFVKWAWNENWIGFDDAQPFVTNSATWVNVPETAIRRIAREVLVDNVRGQGGPWRTEHVQSASLQVRRTKVEGGRWRLEYRGNATMDAGHASFRPTLYGVGLWNPSTRAFEKLEFVANGMRSGKWTFNQRENDPGPAPMGVALQLYLP